MVTTPPQCQAPLLEDQQEEINRLTNVAAQLLTGKPCRSEHTNLYAPDNSLHIIAAPQTGPPVAQTYNGHYGYGYQQE